MKDRISLYPNRVKLVPVEGQENTYDMVRADQPTQMGTPLSKANLLKDLTAAQFGLDSTAVPDDVLSWIGKYNEHWWSLLHGQAYSYYEEADTPFSDSGKWQITGLSEKTKYSYEVEISSTGVVSLKDPVTISGGDYSTKAKAMEKGKEISALSADKPVYLAVYNKSDSSLRGIVKIPVGAGCGQSDTSYTYNISNEYSDGYDVVLNLTGCTPAPLLVESQIIQVPAGETTYEHSTDRNAYPDSGKVDGITYTYLGRPFEKFPTMPRIETGSYTGTGKTGASYPNSLTFGFVPRILILFDDNGKHLTVYGGSAIIANMYLMPTDYAKSAFYNCNYESKNAYAKVSEDKKTVYWYHEYTGNAIYQLNSANVTYHYLALG